MIFQPHEFYFGFILSLLGSEDMERLPKRF